MEREKTAHRRWTEEEKDFLRRNRKGKTLSSIAARLGRTRDSVSGMCKTLNIKRMGAWTEEDDKFIKDNLCMRYCDIARKLNRTPNAVALRVRNLGLSKKHVNGPAPAVPRARRAKKSLDSEWTEEDDRLLRAAYGRVKPTGLLRLFPRHYPDFVLYKVSLLRMELARENGEKWWRK